MPRRRPIRPAATALILALITSPLALAAAPAPAKPVGTAFFTGRWFEIARSPNTKQRDCEAPTYDFETRAGDAAPRFTLTCRKGSPGGRPERLAVKVKLPAGADLSRFRVSALGGLVGVDYSVLDRADDLSWAIMATDGGDHVWLLARKPFLDATTQGRLVGRIGALGYDPARLVYPRHPR